MCVFMDALDASFCFFLSFSLLMIFYSAFHLLEIAHKFTHSLTVFLLQMCIKKYEQPPMCKWVAQIVSKSGSQGNLDHFAHKHARVELLTG